ncbi:MAG: hypothetical protein K1X72_28750 [Pyrinomonadaceae bacterium]|nr:hypothetical protein [Pyrinomonadaceae bacterium]
MKRLLKVIVLVSLTLVVTNIYAQDQVAKEILAQAAKAVLDKENIANASATDIKGKLTAVKIEKGQNADLQNGFYAGILELDVKGDFGKLKSGKFNLFFKSDGQNLNLYLEEKGKISVILEAMTKSPEGLKDTKSGSKPELAFLEVSVDDKLSFNDLPKFNFMSSFTPSFPSRKRCKIWMKITVGGRGYWVWSGFYKQCRGSAT